MRRQFGTDWGQPGRVPAVARAVSENGRFKGQACQAISGLRQLFDFPV